MKYPPCYLINNWHVLEYSRPIKVKASRGSIYLIKNVLAATASSSQGKKFLPERIQTKYYSWQDFIDTLIMAIRRFDVSLTIFGCEPFAVFTVSDFFFCRFSPLCSVTAE